MWDSITLRRDLRYLFSDGNKVDLPCVRVDKQEIDGFTIEVTVP